MKCSACGNTDAYMGFASIDCPNPNCRFYQKANSTNVPTSGNLNKTPSIQNTAGTITQSNQGTAVLTALNVAITAKIPKRNSIMITFVAYGDPGVPNKHVEFLWSLSNSIPKICTLASRHVYFVAGIDADGQTAYSTHWQCSLDGVNPNDPWALTARIH